MVQETAALLAHDMNYVALKLLAPEHLLFTKSRAHPHAPHHRSSFSEIITYRSHGHIRSHSISHLLAADTALPIAGRIIKFAHADKQSRPVTYWYVTS